MSCPPITIWKSGCTNIWKRQGSPQTVPGGCSARRRGTTGQLTEKPLLARNALDLVQRRAKDVGLHGPICNHTFRATGITAYLENGGTLEMAQAIAAHESPRTTKLYDRTADAVTLDEVERIIL